MCACMRAGMCALVNALSTPPPLAATYVRVGGQPMFVNVVRCFRQECGRHHQSRWEELIMMVMLEAVILGMVGYVLMVVHDDVVAA